LVQQIQDKMNSVQMEVLIDNVVVSWIQDTQRFENVQNKKKATQGGFLWKLFKIVCL